MPSMTGKAALKMLKGLGWEVDHIKGSHHYIRHPDYPELGQGCVPIHGNEDLSRKVFFILRKLIRDTEAKIQSDE